MIFSLPRLMRRLSFCVIGTLLAFVGIALVSNVTWVLAAQAPVWKITTVATPTVFTPDLGSKGQQRLAECESNHVPCNDYHLVVENIGSASSSGSVTVEEKLPAGAVFAPGFGQSALSFEPPFNSQFEEFATCEIKSPTTGSCTFTEPIVPSGFVVMTARLQVTAAGPSSLLNTVTVSGGGASPAVDETDTPIGVETEKAPPGIGKFDFDVTGALGEPARQAGGHPHFVTATALLNTMVVENYPLVLPVQPVKDLTFYLPLGFIGNPQATPRCPASLIEAGNGLSGCPASSRVGTVLVMTGGQVAANPFDPMHESGIYNIQPEKGYAAEFAFPSLNFAFFMYANVVRHNGAYMLRVTVPGVPVANGNVFGVIATFFGDIQEHYSVLEEEHVRDEGAFLTNPSDCSAGPLDASMEISTWEHAEIPVRPATAYASVEGCELLRFSSTLTARPSVTRSDPGTTQADEPSGYEMALHVPQAPNSGTGIATPPLKNVSITLPEGTTISPPSANGLEACQETGSHGINIEGAESEVLGADGLPRPAAGHCPAASQLGSVRAITPLLGDEELEGHIYLAAPRCGGGGQAACKPESAEDGELFRLYLELEAPNAGVVVKIPGTASVDSRTGRITADFDDAPQFPVSDLTVAMNSGPRAPLANPQRCGAALSVGDVVPWGAPQAQASPLDSFTVDWNGEGGPCPASMPFAPSFTAGTTHDLAGAYSQLTLTLKREDREQNVTSLTATLPKGLLAAVSNVAQCPEPDASQSPESCPADSQVGTTTVGVGSGSEPYYVTGKVYFTGPYHGAPFGLSVVVPAVAGPFNLGEVIVRAAVRVDPHTAQVTAESDAFPQIIDGVPLRIRTINVTLDAKEFVFNPTSCAAASVTGAIHSAEGAAAAVSSPFAAAGCKGLAFKPVMSLSTEARATKANGTGVKVKISYPVPAGGEANIANVAISFPKQLPVRLTTLNQACRAATFESNPAACPVGSNIGRATVHTPILRQALTGPAYLVSYGSAKFPDVVFVLQGEGVTLDLDGQSFVSRNGTLKVTFSSVPDAPFSSFETVLPPGKYSQFTNAKATAKARVNQCSEKLTASTKLVAQNGAQITKSIRIAIGGCSKAKGKQHKSKAKKQK